MSYSNVTAIDVSSPSGAGAAPPSPTASNTPTLPKLALGSASKGTRRRSNKVAEMQQYLKELEKSHANTRSLVAEIKGPPKRDRATPTRSRRRSTHNYDNYPHTHSSTLCLLHHHIHQVPQEGTDEQSSDIATLRHPPSPLSPAAPSAEINER